MPAGVRGLKKETGTTFLQMKVGQFGPAPPYLMARVEDNRQVIQHYSHFARVLCPLMHLW